MAPGFVMDALHSCNDEWVRRVKNESSVGGGNICRACHSQGRERRGLPASVMGKTSRFPGHGPCLFIYFSSDTFPLGEQKCEIDTVSFESRELIVAEQQSSLIICFQTCGCLLGFLSYFMAHFQRFLLNQANSVCIPYHISEKLGRVSEPCKFLL